MGEIIQLIDENRELCQCWENEFSPYKKDVIIINDDIFKHKTDAIVSPANSFGFMDGGLDQRIIRKIGPHLQQRINDAILCHCPIGELLVGQAIIVHTALDKITMDLMPFPYIIVAPTMRVPMILKDSVNVYLAAKAIFAATKNYYSINTVSIVGLGTGVGQMPSNICAKQMRVAYEEVMLRNPKYPENWLQAQASHQLLYSDSTVDLQYEKQNLLK